MEVEDWSAAEEELSCKCIPAYSSFIINKSHLSGLELFVKLGLLELSFDITQEVVFILSADELVGAFQRAFQREATEWLNPNRTKTQQLSLAIVVEQFQVERSFLLRSVIELEIMKWMLFLL